jgi:opacity protein-like surface antigen
LLLVLLLLVLLVAAVVVAAVVVAAVVVTLAFCFCCSVFAGGTGEGTSSDLHMFMNNL